MATCDLCNREMLTAASCSVDVLHADGRSFRLGPYGSEEDWPTDGRPCGDCGVAEGGLHHVGCDIQRCPRCAGQFISCGCRWDEFAHEYEDEGAA